MLFGQAHFIFQEHNCAELTEVVLDVEAIFLALDDCVATADRDVIYANFGFVATSQFKFCLFLCDCEHVDIARRVLVEWHRFKQDKLRLRTWLLNINKLEKLVLSLEDVWVALLANLTFKLLPVVTGNICSIFLGVSLGLDPAFQALEVDQTDRTSALAGEDEGVAVLRLWVPAEPTLHLLFGVPKFS